MLITLSDVVEIRTAPIFRDKAPEQNKFGNVQALAIRDIVGGWPLHQLPRIQVDDSLLVHCLSRGEVVIPARGDYYPARFFDSQENDIFPLGQINIISPGREINGLYLAWYLNQPKAQKRFSELRSGTGIQALSRKSLLTLEIPLPSLQIQLEIANVLTMWDESKRLRDKVINLQEEEIQAVCHKLVSQSVGVTYDR